MHHQAEIRRLKKMIGGCSRAVIFTGAGISTESGIPDFRSPDGIWSKSTPIYYDEFVSSEAARREAWRRKFDIDRDIDHAELFLKRQEVSSQDDGIVSV